VEEAQGVGLHDLAQVHQTAELLRRGGTRMARMLSPALADASRWLTGQIPQTRAVMPGHFPEGAADAEALEAPELVTWKRASETWPSSSSGW